MRKTLAPKKKSTLRRPKARTAVDPTRLAIAALERIRTVLEQSGHKDWYLPGVSPQELATRQALFGAALPPSYAAAMKLAGGFGEPERLLDAAEITEAQAKLGVRFGEEGARRFFPFAQTEDGILAFDRGVRARRFGSVPPPVRDGEISIVEIEGAVARPHSYNFGHWIDEVADAREESMAAAATLPPRLKDLLSELGFRFDSPLLGRLETSDIHAMEDLLGPERARVVRGDVDRIFDATGRTELTLNVDDFSLTGLLRTGPVRFEAEDVFRWLRSFRNENFYADAPPPRDLRDLARDLREAPREAPLVLRGVTELPALPAQKYTFRAASGESTSDFYLLGRTPSSSGRSPSVILHIVEGVVATAHGMDEQLSDLYVARDGSMWGLTATHAVRFSGGRAKNFPLVRGTPGRTFWYGIGGGGAGGDRVLVWGAGAVLEFDGNGFVPFDPDASLDLSESVISLHSHKRGLSMLVCGDRMGAVASFDGSEWVNIREDQVIEGILADMDLYRGVAYVLDRNGSVWRQERGTAPRPVVWDYRHPAFLTDRGTQRATYSVRSFDGGVLLASDGGVIAISGGEPVFHTVTGAHEAVRLVRVGSEDRVAFGHDSREGAGLIALCGPHVWVWQDGSFDVLDMREW